MPLLTNALPFTRNGPYSPTSNIEMRIVRLFTIVYFFSFITSCSGKCTYKVFDKVSNQRGSLTIVKYFSWCGFTSSNNLNLSLLANQDSLSDETRIVFVALSSVQDKLDRDTTVKYSWLNDTTILIRHDKGIQIFQKKLRLGRVQIKYEIK